MKTRNKSYSYVLFFDSLMDPSKLHCSWWRAEISCFDLEISIRKSRFSSIRKVEKFFFPFSVHRLFFLFMYKMPYTCKFNKYLLLKNYNYKNILSFIWAPFVMIIHVLSSWDFDISKVVFLYKRCALTQSYAFTEAKSVCSTVFSSFEQAIWLVN